MEEEQKIKIGITQGDVNGIGYEMILKTLSEPDICEHFTAIIYGSPKAAAYHRKMLNIQNFSINSIKEAQEAHPKRVNIVTSGDDNIHVEIGKKSQFAEEAANIALNTAKADLEAGKIDALVCAPMNGNALSNKGLKLYISNKLKIGVVAENVAFANVAQYISTERIADAIRIIDKTLKQDFTIRRPRIAVLSLNPEGQTGETEENIIAPAINAVSDEKIYAMGPYTADALFGNGDAYKFDAVLAMYYDQGVAPLKALASDNGAIFTAGIDNIITAPINGVEYSIAGQDVAPCDSFRNALYLAIDTYRNRKNNKELVANPMLTHINNETERNA